MNSMKNKLFQLPVLAFSLLCLSNSLNAQKPKFNPHEDVRDAGMVTPTVIDKMIAVNQVLGKGKVDWKSVGRNYFNYMDRNNYKDENVMVPVMIGMRMSDGVLSIMARDVELLNKSAADIELLAKKIGASAGTFKRANKVKTYANKKDWNRVFLELGFLQKDVLGTLAKKELKNRRVILIASGWLEGAHMMTSVIQKEYSADTAALLREPMLVKQMIKEIEALDATTQKDIVIKSMLGTLKKIYPMVNVPLHGSVTKENVTQIHEATSAFRKLAIANKR